MKKLPIYIFSALIVALLTITLLDKAQLSNLSYLGSRLMLTGQSVKQAKFKDFVANFPQQQLPYNLNAAKLDNYLNNVTQELPTTKMVDQAYQDFFNEPIVDNNKFSRMPSYSQTYYIAKLKETPTTTTLVYARTSSGYRKDKVHTVSFMTANYNANGDLINEIPLASVSSYYYQIAQVDKDLNISIKSFSVSENKRSAPTLSYYKIDEKGAFVETKSLQTPTQEGKASVKD